MQNEYDWEWRRTHGEQMEKSAFLLEQTAESGIPVLLPAAILILVFNIIPLFASFFISMLDMGISFNSAKFIGLDNFKEALTDRRFINSLIVTIKFTVIEVPIQMVLGLVLSAMLTKNTFTNKLFRSIYFIPIVCSATAIGIMWQIILHSNVGLITYWVKLLGFGKVNFLNTPGLTLGVVIFVSVWRTFGISTIILISAMQNVPGDYYEAADIDGAGRIRQFFPSRCLLSCLPSGFAYDKGDWFTAGIRSGIHPHGRRSELYHGNTGDLRV